MDPVTLSCTDPNRGRDRPELSRKQEKEFPILYGRDKKNNCRIWKVTINNTNPDYTEIIVLHGLLNGKQIETITKINTGKNIGKKNETSHYQQALLEAKSKWNKKKDIEHYTTTHPDPNKGQSSMPEQNREDNLVVNNQKTHSRPELSRVPTPMLAHDYKKYKHKLKFPCYIQKKYDGYRLLYDPITNNMYTRNGKKYDILYNTELHKQLKKIGLPLDGELYCHTDFNFECYGILRKKKVSDSTKDSQLLDRIEYHVYDLHNSPCIVQSQSQIETDLGFLTYEQRYALLCDKIKYDNSKIKLVDTYVCTSNENIDEI
jgi:ATP-dependent DNA ligase